MSTFRTLARNISWGYFSYLYTTFVVLWMTPYIIYAIGIEAYGVWVVLQSVVGYYGFIDMGLRASLSQVITNKIARKEFDDVNVFIGSAVPYMAKLGFVIIFISVFVRHTSSHHIKKLLKIDVSTLIFI